MRRVGGGRKKYLIIFLALLAAAAFLVWVIGYYVRDEYHTYKRGAVSEYETEVLAEGDYVLATEKKVLLGKTYAGFSVMDRSGENLIWQCPDLYLVVDLETVGWSGEDGGIVVRLRDGSLISYVKSGELWRKSP